MPRKLIDLFMICFFILMLGIVLLHSGCGIPKRTVVVEHSVVICPDTFPLDTCEPCEKTISRSEVEKAPEIYLECKLNRDRCNSLLELARERYANCQLTYGSD